MNLLLLFRKGKKFLSSIFRDIISFRLELTNKNEKDLVKIAFSSVAVDRHIYMRIQEGRKRPNIFPVAFNSGHINVISVTFMVFRGQRQFLRVQFQHSLGSAGVLFVLEGSMYFIVEICTVCFIRVQEKGILISDS